MFCHHGNQFYPSPSQKPLLCGWRQGLAHVIFTTLSRFKSPISFGCLDYALRAETCKASLLIFTLKKNERAFPDVNI
jgi:hypothetical protein